MERKFASKLSKKPAAEARKQASSQLKENIQSAKLKQVEPIDFDEYIQKNYANLRKDSCSKQLILLPSDDIYKDDYTANELEENQFSEVNDNVDSGNDGRKNKQPIINSLFVNDCLETYRKKRYEIKFKYHVFGGSYKQLPNYSEHLKQFNDNLNHKRLEDRYEIDIENSDQNDPDNLLSPSKNKLQSKYNAQKLEKHGWLSYRLITVQSNEKSYKRRYFHLRACNSPYQSRSNSVDNRQNGLAQVSSNGAKQTSQPYFTMNQKVIYTLECFKEVPGLKRSENPKHQIFFDLNEMHLRNTSDKNMPFSFEIVEKLPYLSNGQNGSLPSQNNGLKGSEALNGNNLTQTHSFTADNQKQFDEWFSILETIIFCNSSKSNSSKMQKSTLFSLLSSPSTASSSNNPSTSSPISQLSSTSNISSLSLPKEPGMSATIAKPEDLTSNSFNSSAESNESVSKSVAVVSKEQLESSTVRSQSNSNQQFLKTFDLNKYLNENEEDLLIKQNEAEKETSQSNSTENRAKVRNKIEQFNPFDFYQRTETTIDDETELDCIYSEKSFGRKLLLNCVQFQLNLHLPAIAISSQSKTSNLAPKLSTQSFNIRSNSATGTHVNPEMFYLTYALYDARNNQKLSANFSWIPNYEVYVSQLINSASSQSISRNLSSGNVSVQTNNAKKFNSSNIFSLDGKIFTDSPQSVLSNELKKPLLNQISKALFTVLDVHEEIYMVVRIEKILDGNSLHSSISPYLVQMNDTNKWKSASRLSKKMHQLIKSQLAAYRQPFAWAAKPIYKKPNVKQNSQLDCELVDNDTPFSIYAQDAAHLSDDDLYKYLADFRYKDKCLNKLTQISGQIKCILTSFPSDLAESSQNFYFNKSYLIDSSCLNEKNVNCEKLNDYILEIDFFEPVFNLDSSLLATLCSNSSSPKKLSLNGDYNEYHSVTDTLSSKESSNLVHNGQPLNNNEQQNAGSTHAQRHLVQTARSLKSNDDFKSLMYVYPKFLKYDTQKVYSKARNILVKAEFRDKDVAYDDSSILKCIFKTNSTAASLYDPNLFTTSYQTSLTYHNKTPQFYDEIKLLLPLNLTEKHHILFKFYHISCSNAKSSATCIDTSEFLDDNSVLHNNNNAISANDTTLSMHSNKNNFESLIGYAWLPVFKNGRILSGEKNLPVAQSLSDNYLSIEQIGMGQIIGPSDIKWVENMKPLFKVNLVALSTIHTTDPHVANFYLQYEKLVLAMTNANSHNHQYNKENKENMTISSSTKRRAPILSQNLIEAAHEKAALASKNGVDGEKSSDIIAINGVLINNSNTKEAVKSSNKTPLNLLWTKPVKEELSLSYHLKALHATDISTIIKFMPTLFNRVLDTLTTTVSGDVALNSVKTLLHFAWQVTIIGKINYLKAFIKYIFHVDYMTNLQNKKNNFPTVHDEIITNLVSFVKQNSPVVQDLAQITRLLKNCWFFFEISLKSLCIYKIQYYQCNKDSTLIFSAGFYSSIRNLYELLIELIIKNGFQSQSGTTNSTTCKDPEFISACKMCNKSLALFIKKSMNVLNRKFLFCLVNKYLEYFHLCDKQLFEIKFDFIRIICNHEHYIAFSLPVRKPISNINEFANIKYEFNLSDQYRQFHFLSGMLLSQLFIALNENKEQRRTAIQVFRNLMLKHSYDLRYNDEKHKQGRIVSLYIPFIDILIENLSRLSSNAFLASNIIGNQIKSMNLSNNGTSSLITDTSSTSSFPQFSRTMSTVTTSTNQTLIAQNNLPSSASASSSGSVYALNFDFSLQRLNNDPLSVIAGIVNPNKLQDHFDSLVVGPMSDSDSLSSADDHANIKSANKRASSSLITSSTTNSDTMNATTLTTTGTTTHPSSSQQNSDLSALSLSKSLQITRKDKLESSEIKDLLICAVYIFKNVSEDALLGLWYNYDDVEFVEFLTLLELCMRTFRYRGKDNVEKLFAISKGQDVKAALIKSPPPGENVLQVIANWSGVQNAGSNVLAPSDLARSVFIESSLCHETSSIVISILSLVLIHQKEKLCESHGDNQIMHRLIEIYFYMLQSNQSEAIKLRVLASFRHLVNKSSGIFMSGHSILCSSLCLEMLKCFNSRFESVRNEACVVLYLLMRKNYEHTKMKSIARVHSQTIISVSQLIGHMTLTSNHEVLECLSLLTNLALKDSTLSHTRFSLEVQDLTRRIQNIFMATAQMKSYESDTETLVDCQYSLAKSYANCVELRKTWLESMASIHLKDHNYSEAAHCFLHIAALVAENLKHQGKYTLGLTVFKKISPNTELEEDINRNNDIMANGDVYSMKDLNEVQYTQGQLLDYLCKSAEMFKLGERYDFLPDIFKLAVAIYEPNRDYIHLQQMHQNIQKAYSYLAERDQRSREKPLAAYYRVSFFGRLFEQENNKVYIYKEPSNTKLFEICDRLRKVYARRFGGEHLVEILCDSRKPAELKLDTANKNYIQITYVQPYFEDTEMQCRVLTYFEKNNNLKRFYYETPYQLDVGSQEPQQQQHSELLNLCKRKFILETSNWFPYVKKRILVVYEKPIELNPLETAIDEIRQKVDDFETILKKKDLTLLELYLQGGIMPQVHKGPLAYAEAFLEPLESNKRYSKELKRKFKLTFKKLIDLYHIGIELYNQLASKMNQSTEESLNNSNNTTTNSANPNNLSSNRILSSVVANYSNNNTTVNLNGNSTNAKHVEMHRILLEKFGELENSFRNLLLIADDDLDLYHQFNNSGRSIRNSQITIGINSSTTSHA